MMKAIPSALFQSVQCLELQNRNELSFGGRRSPEVVVLLFHIVYSDPI